MITIYCIWIIFYPTFYSLVKGVHDSYRIKTEATHNKSPLYNLRNKRPQVVFPINVPLAEWAEIEPCWSKLVLTSFCWILTLYFFISSFLFCFGKVFPVWNFPAFYFMHANCPNGDGNQYFLSCNWNNKQWICLII